MSIFLLQIWISFKVGKLNSVRNRVVFGDLPEETPPIHDCRKHFTTGGWSTALWNGTISVFMLQATGSRSWCCEIVVRQLSKLEPQQKTAQLWAEDFLEWKGSRQSFSPWIISELFFLDLFKASWVQFIAVPRGLVSNLWRGSWGRIFLRRGEETHSLQNEEFFKVMNWWMFWNLMNSESSGLSWIWIATKPGSKFNIGNFQRLELCRPPHLLWGLGITPGKTQKTHRGILELPLTHWAIQLSRCGMHLRGFSVPYPLRFAHFLIAWECLPRKRRRSLGGFWVFGFWGDVCWANFSVKKNDSESWTSLRRTLVILTLLSLVPKAGPDRGHWSFPGLVVGVKTYWNPEGELNINFFQLAF